MEFDILIRCFPSQRRVCRLFLCGYEFLNMASLMLCRNARMIVENHYPFDRFGCTPLHLLSPGPSQFEP